MRMSRLGGRVATVAAAFAACSFASASQAGYGLVITEFFAGIPGTDPTADWFELTWYGSGVFDTSSIWYEDESGDPTLAAQINGLSGIASGESVIVVIGNGTGDVTEFATFFASNLGAGVQIGFSEGPGLGNNDTVNIFSSNMADAMLLASQGGTDGDSPATKVFNPGTGVFGQFAEIGVLGAWGTTFTNSNGSWTIVASPGVVPAPAAAALLGLAGLAGSRRRRG